MSCVQQGPRKKKAAEYLEKEIERSGLQDEVAQVLVPVKKEIVTKNGKRKAVDRLLFFPVMCLSRLS